MYVYWQRRQQKQQRHHEIHTFCTLMNFRFDFRARLPHTWHHIPKICYLMMERIEKYFSEEYLFRWAASIYIFADIQWNAVRLFTLRCKWNACASKKSTKIQFEHVNEIHLLLLVLSFSLISLFMRESNIYLYVKK